MNNLTNSQLLQEIQKRLNTNKIGFWIENQDCYLWENTFHYTNKIKVGDLSQTKENYFAKFIKELEKVAKERQERGNFLNTKFQEISDVELINELKKRTQSQAIKLSMYPNHQHIFIEGKDIKCETITPLPIEIKEKQIESKLDKLSELLDEIEEVRVINSDDPDT
nr:2838_t:CDS:2 [Entrophospora candida]